MSKRMTPQRKLERVLNEIEDLPEYLTNMIENQERFTQVLLSTHAAEIEKIIDYLEDVQQLVNSLMK